VIVQLSAPDADNAEAWYSIRYTNANGNVFGLDYSTDTPTWQPADGAAPYAYNVQSRFYDDVILLTPPDNGCVEYRIGARTYANSEHSLYQSASGVNAQFFTVCAN
jgi:hypothetical protein